jgi:hypothetical protein
MNDSPPLSIGRATVRGYAGGALFMTFFGAFWASFSAFVLGPWQRVLLLLVVGLISIALAGAAVRLLRQARHLPSSTSEEARARGKAQGRRFFLVFGVEFVSIFLAAYLLGIAGFDGFIPPVIALIVGLHFIPLAAVFGVRLYYPTGILISSVAVVALVAMLFGVTLGGEFGWAVMVGMSTALILWVTALGVLRTLAGLLRAEAPARTLI